MPNIPDLLVVLRAHETSIKRRASDIADRAPALPGGTASAYLASAPTSRSTSGRSGPSSTTVKETRSCHGCGRVGHIKPDCRSQHMWAAHRETRAAARAQDGQGGQGGQRPSNGNGHKRASGGQQRQHQAHAVDVRGHPDDGHNHIALAVMGVQPSDGVSLSTTPLEFDDGVDNGGWDVLCQYGYTDLPYVAPLHDPDAYALQGRAGLTNVLAHARKPRRLSTISMVADSGSSAHIYDPLLHGWRPLSAVVPGAITVQVGGGGYVTAIATATLNCFLDVKKRGKDGKYYNDRVVTMAFSKVLIVPGFGTHLMSIISATSAGAVVTLDAERGHRFEKNGFRVPLVVRRNVPMLDITIDQPCIKAATTDLEQAYTTTGGGTSVVSTGIGGSIGDDSGVGTSTTWHGSSSTTTSTSPTSTSSGLTSKAQLG
jgi:hypothetical protein